jgi:hypothetical protein
MSENIAIALISIIGSLLAVGVGGIISLLTQHLIENRKWQREQQEKMLSIKRDAISTVLEWIDPMRNAEIRTRSLVMAAIHGRITQEQFLERFPDLIDKLVKKDLPANQRALLPDRIYACGNKIIKELDELKYFGIKYGQEAQMKKKLLPGFQECLTILNEIDKQINDLETEMRKEYRYSFGEKSFSKK